MPKKHGIKIAISPIIKNLEEQLNLKNDMELAKFLALPDSSTISNWKSRGNADFALIFAKCEGKNIDWNYVFKGKKTEYYTEKYNEFENKFRVMEKRLDKLEREEKIPHDQVPIFPLKTPTPAERESRQGGL